MEENNVVTNNSSKKRRLIVLLSGLGVLILFIVLIIFVFTKPKIVTFENLKGNKIDAVALTDDGYISSDDVTRIMTKINNYSVNENPTSTNVVWDFSGWYLDSSFNNPISDLASQKFKSSTTVYAKWKLHRYKITYEFGGIEITNISSLPTEYVAKHTYPEDLSDWDWSDDNKNKDIWEADFDYTNNIPSFNEAKALTGIELVSPVPKKSKYTFVGWYTDPDFKNKIEKLNNTEPSDITLYAKFEKN